MNPPQKRKKKKRQIAHVAVRDSILRTLFASFVRHSFFKAAARATEVDCATGHFVALSDHTGG
jgi:hypothetical protein